MTTTQYEQTFCIDAAHPALPGHFPGQPLVPGVLLLEQVALALRAWRGQRLGRILEAKFVAPLRPQQTAVLHLREMDAAAARLRFEIQRDGTVLARGVIETVP